MDPTSFTIAVTGLPGIFKSTVDCFNYVRLSRQFGQDFAICTVRLEAARLQLSRWGDAMGFLDEPFDPNAVYNTGPWNNEDVSKAKNWLGLIEDMFTDAKNTSNRFKLTHEGDEPELLGVSDEATELDKASSRVKKAVLSMRMLTGRRQKETSAPRKTEWVVYARDDFDRLMKNISELVENLVVLFPALQSTQEALCLREAEEIEPEAIPLIVQVLGDNDKLLNRALTEKVQTE